MQHSLCFNFQVPYLLYEMGFISAKSISNLTQISCVDPWYIINPHAWGQAPRRPLTFNFVFRILINLNGIHFIRIC